MKFAILGGSGFPTRAVAGVWAALLFTAVVAGLAVFGLPDDGARAQTGLADLKPIQPLAACGALAGLDLAPTTGAATVISSAQETPSAKGVFCRVTGTIQPAIRFEVDLPMKDWTQRYLQTGCGGLCGDLNVDIAHAGTCEPAVDGALVVASDDMGHQNKGPGDASFGANLQMRIDFAYRGNHVTALAAKALIKAFYGQGPRYSYFSGCSDGGREALVEAQRYPDDFDGIAAGAPAMNFQVQNSFYHAWMTRSNTGADGKAILISDRLAILHQAVLAACDALDGLRDGLIADPRACRFDPGSVQCASGVTDPSNCLTAAEVGVVRKFYAGPSDGQGRRFTIGGPQFGSELSWAGVYVPATRDGAIFSRGIAAGATQYVIFPEVSAKDGDIDHFAFTEDTFSRLAALHPLYDATDTNLAPFQARGGKLILWHGWSDPHISPINTIAYFQAVKALMGDQRTNGFARLFLFAGLYHCSGGDGLNQFDILTPLMVWVEQGRAPDRILAGQAPETRRAGGGPPPIRTRPPPLPRADQAPLRTRPVFAYPMTARYTGQGDPNDAASYAAVAGPLSSAKALRWQGAAFMAPGILKTYVVRDGRLATAGS